MLTIGSQVIIIWRSNPWHGRACCQRRSFWRFWNRSQNRPGMYIGSTGPRGLHHLVCWEVVDNSGDEVLPAQPMWSSRANDGSTLTNDGRVFPFPPQTGKLALVKMTVSTGRCLAAAAILLWFARCWRASSSTPCPKWSKSPFGGISGFIPNAFERGNSSNWTEGQSPTKKLHRTSITFKPDLQIPRHRIFDWETLVSVACGISLSVAVSKLRLLITASNYSKAVSCE